MKHMITVVDRNWPETSRFSPELCEFLASHLQPHKVNVSEYNSHKYDDGEFAGKKIISLHVPFFDDRNRRDYEVTFNIVYNNAHQAFSVVFPEITDFDEDTDIRLTAIQKLISELVDNFIARFDIVHMKVREVFMEDGITPTKHKEYVDCESMYDLTHLFITMSNGSKI